MTPGYILSADGSPFEDQDVAAMKRETLAHEFGEAFEVVEHPTGAWAVVRSTDPAPRTIPEAGHPTDPVPIAEAVDGAIPEGPGDVLTRVRSAGGRARPEGYRNTEPAVGVERRLFSAGEHKERLDKSSAPDSDDRARMSRVLDRVHARFIEAVTASRGERLVATPEVAFCRAFRVGEEAVELGLADDLCTLANAIDRVGGAYLRDFTPRRSVLERLSDHIAIRVSGLPGLQTAPRPTCPA